MKKQLLISLLFIGFSFNLCSQTFNGQILSDTGNVTVIKLWGTSYERGYAYGYLCAEEMVQCHEYILSGWQDHWSEIRALIGDGVNFHIDSVYWNEAQAIIDGMTDAGYNSAGIDSLDVIADNCLFDYYYWGFKNSVKGNQCSVLMDWGEATEGTDLDGFSVISAHQDGDPDPFILENFVIVIHIPAEDNLQPWLFIGSLYPMSFCRGLNSSGISMFLTALSDENFTHGTQAGYEPVFFSFRKALESDDYNQDGVNNILDVKDVISSNTLGYSRGYNFASIAPSTAGNDSLIAVIAEVAPEDPYITFRNNSYPDLIPGDNLYCANSQIKRNNSNHYCTRYNNIVNHIGDGTGIGSQENWDLMKNYSHGGINLMFMQYIPEWSQLKLSVYHDGQPAYMHDPVTYDVNSFWQIPSWIQESKEVISKLSVYPNPFTTSTTLSYTLNELSTVTIGIFNSQGKLIEIVNQEQAGGEQNIIWNAEELPNGMYYFRIQAGDKIGGGKMVKME